MTPEQKAEAAKKAANVVLPFIKDDATFDEVFKSHQNFNALLTAVVSVAREQALRVLPQLTQQMVEQKVTLQMAAKEFFTENKDLLPYRAFLASLSNEIESKEPNLSLEELFQKINEEGRKRLRLPKGSQGAGTQMIQNKETKTVNPGFVSGGGKSGNRGSSTPLTGMDKDIMDLIED